MTMRRRTTLVVAAFATLAVLAPAPTGAAQTLGAPVPPPGAIASAVVGNQLKYCALICPHIVDFVVDVPTAIVGAPRVFIDAQQRTGSRDRATGIAFASVTSPARSAMSGIIGNDLNLVLPRAQNALEVAIVEMLHVLDVARSGAGSGRVQRAFNAGRAQIVDALNAPIVENPPPLARPRTQQQASVVDAIDVGSAVLFRAPEVVLAGATEAADIAASHLARTGDMSGARIVGTDHLAAVVADAARAIDTATRTHAVPTMRR